MNGVNGNAFIFCLSLAGQPKGWPAQCPVLFLFDLFYLCISIVGFTPINLGRHLFNFSNGQRLSRTSTTQRTGSSFESGRDEEGGASWTRRSSSTAKYQTTRTVQQQPQPTATTVTSIHLEPADHPVRKWINSCLIIRLNPDPGVEL